MQSSSGQSLHANHQSLPSAWQVIASEVLSRLGLFGIVQELLMANGLDLGLIFVVKKKELRDVASYPERHAFIIATQQCQMPAMMAYHYLQGDATYIIYACKKARTMQTYV